jgi:Flp pilus assembly protein CpaB
VNSRRIIILLVAVVIAAAASLGLLSYVKGLEGEAYEGSQLESVWVVKDVIPKGTPAQQVISGGLIAQEEVPVEFRPATAIENPGEELAGLVAVTNLAPNSVLVTGNFVAPGVVNTGITDRLKERGMVTLTFTLDQVSAVAYLIEPGDHVNIMTKKSLAAEEEDTNGAEDSAEVVGEDGTVTRTEPLFTTDVRYLFQQVEVLAIGGALPSELGDTPAAEGEVAATGGSGLITLAVPPEAAQLMLSIGIDSLYLSLLPANYVPYALPPIDLEQTVLPGEDVARLTPYGPPSGQPQTSEDEQ